MEEASKKPVECYYFGCQGQPGHYWWKPDGTKLWGQDIDELTGERIWPRIDGGFCPGASEDRKKPWQRLGPEVEGQAAIHYVGSWTIVGFWDRSVDKRGACNSNFIVRGKHTFEEVMAIAKETFPQVMSRLKFEVKLIIGGPSV